MIRKNTRIPKDRKNTKIIKRLKVQAKWFLLQGQKGPNIQMMSPQCLTKVTVYHLPQDQIKFQE